MRHEMGRLARRSIFLIPYSLFLIKAHKRDVMRLLGCGDRVGCLCVQKVTEIDERDHCVFVRYQAG